MNELSYSKIQDYLAKVDLTPLPVFNISIMRNITVEPIETYLRYFVMKIGFNANVSFGEYDLIYQEAIGGRPDLLNESTDCVIIFIRLDTLSWNLARNFLSLDKSGIQSEVERIKNYITAVLAGIRKQTAAAILWHCFEFPIYPALGILDSQISDNHTAVIGELNEYLKTCLRKQKNAYLIDLNFCLARVGAEKFYDLRYWHIGRAPFTRKALLEIAKEDARFIRSIKGKSKKCLVIDCDNILWGGIVGEDGLAGIKIGKTYPGSSYYEFQQEVLNLYNRGVILALCSKNNEEDVWEVFKKHPDMVLKKEHIAASQINWDDKVVNLKRIAKDLNIGIDSLVFVDDSEFEINLIRQMLPDVEVIHMHANKAVEYRDILASCGLFESLTFSEEDKQRGAMYRAEANRRKLKAQTTNLASYYKFLEMELGIRFPNDFAIPRIAQLTQRTNQFNLTTRRYTESDIRSFSESNNSDVIYITLDDRFGGSGIVGVCILKYLGKQAIFDTFLLSCRVLGRGLEDVLLIQALKLAKSKNCETAVGQYFPSPKNSQTERFYEKQGFKQAEFDKEKLIFHYALNSAIRKEPLYFKKIVTEVNCKEEKSF